MVDRVAGRGVVEITLLNAEDLLRLSRAIQGREAQQRADAPEGKEGQTLDLLLVYYHAVGAGGMGRAGSLKRKGLGEGDLGFCCAQPRTLLKPTPAGLKTHLWDLRP
jgi:hypothetical protein